MSLGFDIAPMCKGECCTNLLTSYVDYKNGYCGLCYEEKSKMTFEELREVEHGSVLVSEDGSEFIFLGVTPSGKYIEVNNSVDENLVFYDNYEIKDWTLKKPEPKYEIFEEWYYPVSEQFKMLPSTVLRGYESTVGGDSVEAFKVEGGRKVKVYENGRAEVINE